MKVTSVVTGPLTSRFAGICLSVSASLMLTPVAVGAADFTSVQVGYQRQAQVGTWMPVHVSADGLSPGQSVSLAMTAPDPRGNPVVRICGTNEADSEGRVVLAGLGRTGRTDGTLQIELVETDGSASICSTSIRCSEQRLLKAAGPIQRRLRLYRHNVRFMLTIGQPAGIDTLLSQAAKISPDTPLVVGVSIPAGELLPRSSQDYDMFSTIVFTGNVELDEQQFIALKSWIHAGGNLIVSLTDQLEDFLATPLGKWLHARFDISTEMRQVTDVDLGALQQIVPRATRISTNRRRVRMAQLRDKQPLRLAESSNGSLVGRLSCGGGQVTVVSLDLSKTPLSQWNSLADFYAVLMFGAPLTKAADRANSSRISSSGVGDLTTQLMKTVDPIPESGRWTTWSVMTLGFAWLLLIGPIDYLIVVVLLKRPQLTWITFPVWVAVGFASLYAVKSAASGIVLNSVHVVSVAEDGDDQSIEAFSLLSLSAPSTSRQDLQAIPDSALSGAEPTLSLTWAGRPEDVYGGMYRTTGIGGGAAPYRSHADATASLAFVPLLADGSFECQARWSAESETRLVSSSLNVSGFGILDGTFEHHLPMTIHDWFVVYGNRVYRARDDARKSLPAGQPWTFEPGAAEISDIKTWLVGERELRKPPARKPLGQFSGVIPYNSRGRDALDIVTMMSLYQAAGAEGYTGLAHHSLHRMDVSQSIRLNCAVVIGWSEQPATRLELGETEVRESASMTIVRLLLPVDRRPAKPTALNDQQIEDAKKREQKSANDPFPIETPSADDDN